MKLIQSSDEYVVFDVENMGMKAETQDVKKRACRAALEFILSQLGTLRTYFEVFPCSDYDIEVEKDDRGVVRLMKDEDGYVHFRFHLLRIGPIAGLRLLARAPAEFPAGAEGGALAAAGSRYYGVLPSRGDRLAVMIMNK